jgi:alpha-ketoglutarate-dependent taurine dioxygenase
MPPQFVSGISKLAKSHKQASNRITEIQTALETLIEQHFPQLLALGKNIVDSLESEQGFVIVKNLPFISYQRPLSDWLFLALLACIGKLTDHDNCQKLLWEVKNHGKISNREATFSELNVEAPWHTDSAFRSKPEDYFGLFVINPAKVGGDSLVMQVEQILRSLQQSDEGWRCLEILRSEKFPFRVPPAFAGDCAENKVIFAPIIGESPLIRFRFDTILAGFKCCPELVTPGRMWALHYFNRFLETYGARSQMKLDEGDIIFINNHTVLHGRTAFKGCDRLLLRARVTKKSGMGA